MTETEESREVFSLGLPDIHPTRSERCVFWVKAHLHIWKMNRRQRQGRGVDTAQLIADAEELQQKAK